MSNLDKFMAAYEPALVAAIVAHPEEYAYPVAGVPKVVAKMRAAMVSGSFNHNGYAYKGACRALGIKHTRKAIMAFLAEGAEGGPAERA